MAINETPFKVHSHMTTATALQLDHMVTSGAVHIALALALALATSQMNGPFIATATTTK